MTLGRQPEVPRGHVPWVMRRLGKAIAAHEQPAVEKIAAAEQDNAFEVLIATMLSAQTRDPVTAAASARLFAVARTPRTIARMTAAEIEGLIYPVSFYRHKAVHVKETCAQLLTRFNGIVPSTMPELLRKLRPSAATFVVIR